MALARFISEVSGRVGAGERGMVLTWEGRWKDSELSIALYVHYLTFQYCKKGEYKQSYLESIERSDSDCT